MEYWVLFFFWGEGVNFAAWIVLEALALATLRGRLRLYALLPVPIMILLAAASLRSYVAGTFTWPLLLMLGSPPVAFGTGVLVFRGVLAQGHPRARRIQYATVAVLVAAFLVGILRFFA